MPSAGGNHDLTTVLEVEDSIFLDSPDEMEDPDELYRLESEIMEIEDDDLNFSSVEEIPESEPMVVEHESWIRDEY